jgi:putative ABC transport system permease protein
MRILQLGARDLLSRPVRLLLTVIGVAIAVGTFVALDGVVRGFQRALTSTVAASGTHLHVAEKGSIDFLSSVVPQSLATRIAEVPGVQAAAPVLIRMVPIATGDTVPILGWPDGAYLWATIRIVAGRLPQNDDRIEVVLGAALAEKLRVRDGDQVSVLGAQLTVVGVADSASHLHRGTIFMRLSDLQSLTFRNGQATSVSVRLQAGGPATLEEKIQAIAARAHGFTVIDAETLIRDNFLVVLTQSLVRTVSVIAFLLAFLGVLNNILSAVRDRRHEFAILRAVGWPLRRIGLLMLSQAGIVSLLGMALGLALGQLATRVAAHLSAISPFVEAGIDAPTFVSALVTALVISALSVLAPLWAVARIDPAQTLRSP